MCLLIEEFYYNTIFQKFELHLWKIFLDKEFAYLVSYSFSKTEHLVMNFIASNWWFIF